MSVEVAGHYFSDKPTWDEKCHRSRGDGEPCQIRRRDLVGITQADIGVSNLAHIGTINSHEATQCEELTKLWHEYCEHIAAQTTGVCGR